MRDPLARMDTGSEPPVLAADVRRCRVNSRDFTRSTRLLWPKRQAERLGRLSDPVVETYQCQSRDHRPGRERRGQVDRIKRANRLTGEGPAGAFDDFRADAQDVPMRDKRTDGSHVQRNRRYDSSPAKSELRGNSVWSRKARTPFSASSYTGSKLCEEQQC